MGRQMPTECLHGYIIDPGDFDAKIENCPHCNRGKCFSYDTMMHVLANAHGHTDDEVYEARRWAHQEIEHMQRVIDRTARIRLDLESENRRLTAESRVKDKLLGAWLESDTYDDGDLQKLRGMTLRGEWDAASDRPAPESD